MSFITGLLFGFVSLFSLHPLQRRNTYLIQCQRHLYILGNKIRDEMCKKIP